MRRLIMLLAVFSLALPAAAGAQARLGVGVGLSAPSGDLGDVANSGYHALASLQFTIPTLPMALRGDGAVHGLGSAVTGADDVGILAGALSLVFTLPGVGLQPYLLGGIGSYSVRSGPGTDRTSVSDRGYHGGFGVVLGGAGTGFFAEIRYVKIDVEGSASLIPLTVGLRF